jgi:acetyl-CoA synthetase
MRPTRYVIKRVSQFRSTRLYSQQHAIYRIGKQNVQLGQMLCDNHNPDKVALKYISTSPHATVPDIYDEMTFGQLQSLSNSIAQFLLDHHLEKGGRVAVLLPKTKELFASSVGIWRAGACYVPLFTAFAYEAIKHRVLDSGAKFIITDKANRSKLDKIPEIVNDPSMTIITVTSDAITNKTGAKEYNFNEMMTKTRPKHVINESIHPDNDIILLYTSGTTGLPKAVQIPAHSLNAFETYMSYSLFVEPNDVFWNIAGMFLLVVLS